MRNYLSFLFILSLLSLHTPEAHAQKWKKALHNVDSLVSLRYQRADIDTLYIIRPATKWTAKIRVNNSATQIKTLGVIDGSKSTSQMNADYKTTISAAISYMGISMGIALNPAKLLGKHKDFLFNLNSYGKRMGYDIIYKNAKNFKGWHETEGSEHTTLPSDILSLRTLNLNAYYTLNHRRFSYPAAFTQSYIQRRSAGSILLAASFQGQRAIVSNIRDSRLKVMNLAFGGGYGHNFVVAEKWLFHISTLPTFIVYSHASLLENGTRIPLHYHFPEVIMTSRGAIVRQMGRYFTGATMVFNFTSIGSDKNLMVQNNNWYVRAFVGYRF